MSRPVTLIVNPASNGGRSAKAVPGIQAQLQSQGSDVEVEMTTSLDHAKELAQTAIARDRVAVACGGDGLVSAVSCAVADGRPEGLVGIIPNGRGNDFARWLGISSTAVGVEAVLRGRVESVDLGYVNKLPFTCVASVGLDSDVLQIAEHTKLVRGPAVYPYATVKALLQWKPIDFELTIDGVRRDFKGFNVVVANGGSYGGGMRIAPDASVTDGFFDVVTISDCSRATFLKVAPKIFKGGHVSHPAVQIVKAKSVEVVADRSLPLCIDGELASESPLKAAVRPKAVKMLVPA